MIEITETDRAVARIAAAAFGGQPHVDRYYDRDETHAIDLLSAAGPPATGEVRYSTVGLYRVPNHLEGADIRVELAGSAPAEATRFPNALATAAFTVMKDGWLAAPGVVFPSLLSQYDLSETLDHVMWLEPEPWPDLHRAAVTGGDAVHWLLAVPISEAERHLLHTEGYDALDVLLRAAEVDHADLDRPSVV